MPLQSFISRASLLVVNESVSDSSRMSPRSLFFPHTHTFHAAAKLTRLPQRGPANISASLSPPLLGQREMAGGPSVGRLQGEGLLRAYCKNRLWTDCLNEVE